MLGRDAPYDIAVVPGDGIGPAVVGASLPVLAETAESRLEPPTLTADAVDQLAGAPGAVDAAPAAFRRAGPVTRRRPTARPTDCQR